MMKTAKRSSWLLRQNYCSYPFMPLIILAGILMLSGCRSRAAIPTLQPTTEKSPASTATSFQIPQSTDNPLPPISPSATPRQPIQLKTKVYNHPGGLFTLRVPETWKINQDQYSASFSDPQGKAHIYVVPINTGYSLDQEAFDRLVDARETNTFSSYDDFIEIDRQNSSATNSITVKKQFLNDGDPKSVESLYRQQGQAVLILDFWSERSDFEAYQPALKDILESANANTGTVSNLQIYSSEGGITTQNDYFSVTVPPSWIARHTSGDQTVVDTFSSPDERAFLQSVVYDDGQPLSRMVAGNIVRTMLREQYAKDVVVHSDSFLADGREQLTWDSKIGNYQGITWFGMRDTTLFSLTVMWDKDLSEYYQGALENIVSTYKILPSEEG